MKEGSFRVCHKDAILQQLRPNDKTVDALMKLDLAAGVDVQIKLG